MKTTVDLPDELYGATRRYASAHGKTFRQVLVDSLTSFVGPSQEADSRPGWEQLAGAFKDDPGIDELRATIDREFSQIDLESWK